MTLEDLMNTFERAVAKAAPFPQHHEDGIYEGIRAVVEALRDEMFCNRPLRNASVGHHCQEVFNEILASDDDGKAAGCSTREDGRDCSPVGARPQDAQSTPAAAPVCQWTKLHSVRNDYRINCAPDPSHVYHPADKWLAGTVCPCCGKPISFKSEAAR
jgi:hypothetical protein